MNITVTPYSVTGRPISEQMSPIRGNTIHGTDSALKVGLNIVRAFTTSPLLPVAVSSILDAGSQTLKALNHNNVVETMPSQADKADTALTLKAVDYSSRAYDTTDSNAIASSEKLQEVFGLSPEGADQLAKSMRQADVRLHQDPEFGLVFSARGTASLGDVVQDVATAFGKSGEKYKALRNIVSLFKANNIHPDLYTGHSLGGGIAIAAHKSMGDENAKTRVFDAQLLNNKQYKAAASHLSSDDAEAPSEKELDMKNVRFSGPSLGSLMKLGGYSNASVVDVKLDAKTNFDLTSAVKLLGYPQLSAAMQLQKNHSLDNIQNALTGST